MYVPRAVLVDSDSTLLNTIGGRHCNGNAFRKENFVGGHGGTGSNWAKGYYGGGEMSRRVAEAVRSEVERCDRLQGFQLVHSLGGGTGSGLGVRVLNNVRVSYPNRVTHTYSVAPWTAVSDEPAESYNALLSAARLVGGAHATYIADNRALFDTCCGGTAAPAYADLNHLVSQIMSGTTTGLRFAGRLNADMKKCTANLVPYPRLHFFVPGFAPITFRGQTDACAYTVPELATQLFRAVRLQRRCIGSAGTAAAVVMAAVMTFRGRSLLNEPRSDHVPLQPATGQTTTAPKRCWIPDNIKTDSYGVLSHGLKNSGTVVANTTAVRDVFERFCRRSASMMAKRELLHLYMEEGMDGDEFRVALEQVESLTAEYLTIERNNRSGDDDDDDDDVDDRQSSRNMDCTATT